MQLTPQKTAPLHFSAQTLINSEQWMRILPTLFYIILGALGLAWVMLGNTWYSQILPFYDSLAYQTRVEAILRAYQTQGWGALSWYGFYGPNSFLYVPFFVVLAPILPLSRTVLYVYQIPIHLTALAVLFNFIRRKTGSLSLALSGPFLYLSTIPFGLSYSGILDQRMDLSTASFSLLLWVTGLDWAENYTSKKKTVFFGIITVLAFLHRPVISVQASLVVIMIVLYAFWMAHQAKQEKILLQSLGLAVLIAGLLSIPWFITNLRFFYFYYFANSPIIGSTSMLGTISAYLGYLKDWIGVNVLVLVGVLIVIAIVSGRFSWKYFLLSIGTILLPVVPLILFGSDSSIVSQICLAGIGLLPLAFVKQKQPLDYGFRYAAVLLAMAFAFTNLTTLVKSVNSTDPTARLQEEALIMQLAQKYPADKPIYLSGYISAGEGIDTIVSIARLDLGYPLQAGAAAFHAFQFGLPTQATQFSDEELDNAAACGLQKAYKVGGFLILVDPARVEEKEIQDWLNAHFFSNHIAARMDRIALASGRLEDTGISGLLGIIPVRFYNIKPGEDLSMNCP